MTESLGISKIENLPKIFLAKRVWPMKIGVADDLLARYPNAQDRKIVKKALSALVKTLTYSNAVIEEDRRYDLDLNPVYDKTGEITDQSRADAQNNIKCALDKIRKRKMQGSAQ
ncbi:ProQ/FINO family protein [uncultured Roseibium sp.]|uniref:ProQ/FINO family protein n=1 Tax=uncultured Roseibium sp. TaxID=1936171 RepID=UPI00262BADED|nr:ProQ/FINO family protein [uncultured Roseibium sp.]